MGLLVRRGVRWAYDVGEQMIMAESPNWYANLAVGALFTGDGFDEPRRSAELVMQCVITSGLYPKFTGREPGSGPRR